jgi:hypothetical protein
LFGSAVAATQVSNLEREKISNNVKKDRENKKYSSTLIHPVQNRKKYTGNSITLAERKDHESRQ